MATALAAIGGKVLFGAAATVAGAVIGSRATGKAASAAAKGQDQALAATTAAAAQGRRDVTSGFEAAEEGRRRGFSSAADFIGGNIGTQIRPSQQGNVAAQQQIARGLPQIQNAILGLPTDLSGFQAKQIGQPGDFNIQNPFPQPVAPQPTQSPGGFNFNSDQLNAIRNSLQNIGNIGGGLAGLNFRIGQ